MFLAAFTSALPPKPQAVQTKTQPAFGTRTSPA